MSSLRLFAVCLLALSFASVTVQSQTCGFGDFDFSSLKGSDIQGSDGSPTYTYYLSVCGTVSNQVCLTGTGGSTQASACQLDVGKSTPYVAGLWPTSQPFPTWGYIDPSNPDIGVMYQMVGTQNCHPLGPAQLYYSNVLFVCAEKQGDLTINIPTLSCTQNYTLPTPLACPGSGGGGGGGGGDDGGKKHLSGGWIFIIILSVVIPVYVVVGCVYKSQKLGATGIDRCPNVEFWRDCPSLVKDGCVFTFRKLRGLCGGSGKEDSYQTM